MTRSNSLFFKLMLIGATSALSLPVLSDPPAKNLLPPTALPPTSAKMAVLVSDIGRLPLSFESNQGQTNSQVRFLTHNGESTLFLTPSEAVFSLPAPRSMKSRQKPALQADRKTESAMKKIARVTLRMQMVGADPKATTLTQQALPGRINYFLGKDRSQWHTGVPTFGRVGFQGVYPGVDLVYYGNQRHLEYDFLVAPHADPTQIKLHFVGAQRVRVNAAGDLFVRTQGRELHWQKPAVYQQDRAGKHAVAARFRLKRLPSGQTGVSFALGRYDTARPLVIDPVLLYSTYLSGNQGEDPEGIAVDSSGNAYITGYASSTNFPTTTGAFQQVNHAPAGYANAFVTKLDSTGSVLLYSTYLGGNSGDFAYGIAVDSSGNAYVTGQAASTNFPTTTGAYQRVDHGVGVYATAFVTKLNSTGSDLVYSTFLGGSYGDIAYSIAVDTSGNAYVTGPTSSTDFPTTSGAYQRVHRAPGTHNAFVTKLNSTGTDLVYSTFLGGSGGGSGSKGDNSFGIALDTSGNAYVTGGTDSLDFPTTTGAFQRVNNGNPALNTTNAFVTKVNSTGTDLVYSTFLGGTRQDSGEGIAVDSNGNAYVTGFANSDGFPTTTGAFQRAKNVGASSAFVTKLNSTGTALLYSTLLGGFTNDIGIGIALDSSGNACVTGYASSTGFPTTPDAFQRVKTAGSGSNNSFVTKFNSTGAALLYSTYLGGSISDSAHSIAVNSSGKVYVTGQTSSTDYPTTPGAFQGPPTAGPLRTYGFVTKLLPLYVFPDFNNDGYTDLIFQDNAGVVYAWFMNGLTVLGGSSVNTVPQAGWKVVGTGDFSGTGHADLLFQNQTTGNLVVWYLNGVTLLSGSATSAQPAPDYKVVGIADFNHDGQPDILFQSQTTGQMVVWFMNGTTYIGGQAIGAPLGTGEKVVGTGDFNNDGQPDIVTQLSINNQVNIYYMNGATITGSNRFLFPLPGTLVLGVGDYNNDGYADLVVKDPTRGEVAIMFMQNTTILGGNPITTQPPTTYQFVGPR